MNSRTHSKATQELLETVAWYERQQVGVGAAFLAEFDRATDQIAAEPLRFARLETYRGKRDIRRALLEPFPYAIVFELRTDGILILSVSHTSRRPNYWSRRSE